MSTISTMIADDEVTPRTDAEWADHVETKKLLAQAALDGTFKTLMDSLAQEHVELSKPPKKLKLREDKVNTYAPWSTLTTPGGQWHLYLHTPIVLMKDADPDTGKCWSNYVVLPSVEQK